jgi:hypothetical protein
VVRAGIEKVDYIGIDGIVESEGEGWRELTANRGTATAAAAKVEAARGDGFFVF